MLVSGTNALVFQAKDLEFFTDQRFRAAPCLSTEFLKSWFCNDLRFCALHRKAREILPDPERERAPARHAKSYAIQNANELGCSVKS